MTKRWLSLLLALLMAFGTGAAIAEFSPTALQAEIEFLGQLGWSVSVEESDAYFARGGYVATAYTDEYEKALEGGTEVVSISRLLENGQVTHLGLMLPYSASARTALLWALEKIYGSSASVMGLEPLWRPDENTLIMYADTDDYNGIMWMDVRADDTFATVASLLDIKPGAFSAESTRRADQARTGAARQPSATGFTLRNGVTFGMTKDQVIAAEGAAGGDTGDGTLFYWEQTIVGFPATLAYSFGGDTLRSINYLFHLGLDAEDQYISKYQTVCASLEEKYGKPGYEGQNWINGRYRSEMARWDYAVSIGDLEYSALWTLDAVDIALLLYLDEDEVIMGLTYHPPGSAAPSAPTTDDI